MFSNSSSNFFLGSLFGILLICPVACSPKPENKKKSPPASSAVVSELPPITLIRENGEQFSANTLSGKTILIFFGASCDHCQREAGQIHDHLKSFEQYTLYFVALDPFPVIHQFAEQYGISGKPNILFVQADGASVNRSLGYLQTPTIIVYNDQGKLVKRFDGETPVEKILGVL